jgi:hypothetical protein
MFTKAYIAKMSGNDMSIMIDQDEIEKVIDAINKKQVVVIRQGLINPSFIIGIMLDHKRVREWIEDIARGDEQKRLNGITPIQNIFKGTPIYDRMLAGDQERKRLASLSPDLSTSRIEGRK